MSTIEKVKFDRNINFDKILQNTWVLKLLKTLIEMVWLFSSVLRTTLEGHLGGEASMKWAHPQNILLFFWDFTFKVKSLEILVSMFEKYLRILNPRIKYPRSSGFWGARIPNPRIQDTWVPKSKHRKGRFDWTWLLVTIFYSKLKNLKKIKKFFY